MTKFIRMPIRTVLVATLVILMSAVQGRARAQETRYQFAQIHMGMTVRLVLYAGDETMARHGAAAAFARIEKLEDIMSDYRDESELRQLSRRGGDWVSLSPDLQAVLLRALEVAERSGGAFDPTVGPYVNLWRRARETGRRPPEELLEQARQVVGWGRVELDSTNRQVRLDTTGMVLDLGGIAKGYILEQALAELRDLGIPSALLTAGGDILAGDPPPGEPGWRIHLEGAGRALRERAQSLANVALAASGDSEQFVVIDGVRYSHVVDPRTGMAITTGRRAYVIAPDGATADALATALTVLDEAGGRRLLQHYPRVLAEVLR